MVIITLNNNLKKVNNYLPINRYSLKRHKHVKKFQMLTEPRRFGYAPNLKSRLIGQSTTKKLCHVEGQTQHNFINAILQAYNNHANLRITPDDILQCLTTVVSACVDKYSDRLRHVFVNHSGKETLKIQTDYLDFEDIVEKMNEEIDKHVKVNLNLESSFSTSTAITKTVSNLMKMSTFKSYFDYEIECLCGIAKVDLTGTLDDWMMLRQKAVNCITVFNRERLLVDWGKHFITVLDKLIETYKGNVDGRFWSLIIRDIPYGSGGQFKIGGWSRVLVPGSKFDSFPERLTVLEPECTTERERTEYSVRERNELSFDISSSVSKIDAVLIVDSDTYDLKFVTGHIGWNVDENKFYEAELGYLIYITPKDESEYVLDLVHTEFYDYSDNDDDDTFSKNKSKQVIDDLTYPVAVIQRKYTLFERFKMFVSTIVDKVKPKPKSEPNPETESILESEPKKFKRNSQLTVYEIYKYFYTDDGIWKD